MALYKARDLDEAIRLTNEIQAYQVQGHSCGIYSRSDENIMKLANATKTSRVMVNQPQAPSNSGNLRSEEHTSELQSLMRISYAVFCLNKKINNHTHNITSYNRITSYSTYQLTTQSS